MSSSTCSGRGADEVLVKPWVRDLCEIQRIIVVARRTCLRLERDGDWESEGDDEIQQDTAKLVSEREDGFRDHV